MEQGVIVRLEQVEQRYGRGKPVLRELELKVRKGEFISVIGPSGAGKTTLLRVLNGAAGISRGQVEIFGERFDSLRGKRKRRIQKRIGTIYQDFCLVDYSTCMQNVLNGCLADLSFIRVLLGWFTGEQRSRAMEALTAVGLAEKAGSRAGHLSGGQKQRAAIARALMQEPELLLADEPMASLDPASGRQVLDLLKKLQKERGITVIMNSHSIPAALEYSERIIGLKDGAVLFDLPADKVGNELLAGLYQGGGWAEEKEVSASEGDLCEDI